MSVPTKAMVLAAGLGTRLRPLTTALPKPAVPLCGVPPLRYTLARLSAAGVREVVVNTHWLPEAIHRAVGDPADLGLTVHFSHEDPILGTGGGLKKVEARFRDAPFLLVNGKLLFDADLEALVAFHEARGAVATMLLRPYPDGATYSPIEVDPEGRIRRFVGRFEWDGPLEKTMFTGVHVLEPRVLDALPAGVEVCINQTAYPALIGQDAPVYGFVQRAGYFAEPSTPARYLAAVRDLLSGAVDLERFRAGGVDPFAGCEDRGGRCFVDPAARVHPSARLTGPLWIGPGAEVGEGSEVGPLVALEGGARVGPGARLTGTVVWPDTAVGREEILEGTIAAGDERVRVDAA